MTGRFCKQGPTHGKEKAMLRAVNIDVEVQSCRHRQPSKIISLRDRRYLNKTSVDVAAPLDITVPKPHRNAFHNVYERVHKKFDLENLRGGTSAASGERTASSK